MLADCTSALLTLMFKAIYSLSSNLLSFLPHLSLSCLLLNWMIFCNHSSQNTSPNLWLPFFTSLVWSRFSLSLNGYFMSTDCQVPFTLLKLLTCRIDHLHSILALWVGIIYFKSQMRKQPQRSNVTYSWSPDKCHLLSKACHGCNEGSDLLCP